MSEWTVPPPSSQGRPGWQPQRPVRGGMVALGAGIALFAQVLAIGVGILATGDAADAVRLVLILQIPVFIGVLVAGVLLIVKGDRGLGIGLFIGWAIGIVALPVVGFGVCVWAFSGTTV